MATCNRCGGTLPLTTTSGAPAPSTKGRTAETVPEATGILGALTARQAGAAPSGHAGASRVSSEGIAGLANRIRTAFGAATREPDAVPEPAGILGAVGARSTS
jgi:hypothetical protein